MSVRGWPIRVMGGVMGGLWGYYGRGAGILWAIDG